MRLPSSCRQYVNATLPYFPSESAFVDRAARRGNKRDPPHCRVRPSGWTEASPEPSRARTTPGETLGVNVLIRQTSYAVLCITSDKSASTIDMLGKALFALSIAGLAQAQVDSTSTLKLAKRYIGNDFTSGFGEPPHIDVDFADCSDFFTQADPTGLF